MSGNDLKTGECNIFITIVYWS